MRWVLTVSSQRRCNLEGVLARYCCGDVGNRPKKEEWAKRKDSSKCTECANVREARPLLQHLLEGYYRVSPRTMKLNFSSSEASCPDFHRKVLMKSLLPLIQIKDGLVLPILNPCSLRWHCGCRSDLPSPAVHGLIRRLCPF